MRSGLFPSQQRAMRKALKKADKFDHFRTRTRRAFVALGALGVAGAVGGFFLGRATVSKDPGPVSVSPLEGRREYARELAQGPLDGLVNAHQSFLMVLNRLEPDSILWSGFARLVDVAITRRDVRLAKRLLPTFSVHDVPMPTQELATALAQITK
jgi:hypothetical protein